ATLRARARPSVLALIYAIQLPAHFGVLYVMVRGWGIRGAAAALLLRSLVDLAIERIVAGRTLGTALGGLAETSWALVACGLLTVACEATESSWLRLIWGLGVGAGLAFSLLTAEDWETLLHAAMPWRWANRN